MASFAGASCATIAPASTLSTEPLPIRGIRTEPATLPRKRRRELGFDFFEFFIVFFLGNDLAVRAQKNINPTFPQWMAHITPLTRACPILNRWLYTPAQRRRQIPQ